MRQLRIILLSSNYLITLLMRIYKNLPVFQLWLTNTFCVLAVRRKAKGTAKTKHDIKNSLTQTNQREKCSTAV